MTLSPVKLYICKISLTRAHIYYHTIIFFKKSDNKNKKRKDFFIMTLFRKSVMKVSWMCHGIMAEDVVTAILMLFLACLLIWRASGGAAC